MKLTLPDSAIRRIASTQHEAFWTKREREKTKIVDILMAAGYGDWIAGMLADEYLDGNLYNIDEETLQLIESQKVAGIWDDFRRVVTPRMDMQPWWDELAAKLEAVGSSIYNFDSNELLVWHEDGYSTDDVFQLVTQGG